MFGWILFYFLSFSLLACSKKVVQFVYPFFFWIFVGFRDNIGTDYPLTLISVERSYMPFSEISTNFFGYNIIDLEATHKFIAMFMCSLNAPMRVYYVILAAIEAIIIGYIIKKSKHYRLFLFFFICIFSINYPMNAVRQGLSLILVVLAVFLENQDGVIRNNRFKSYLATFLAVASHYGSMIVPVFYSLKINKFRSYVFAGIIAAAAFAIITFLGQDMLGDRYEDTDEVYRISGGLRLFLFAIVLAFTYVAVIGRGVKNQDFIILIALLVGVFLHNSLLRVYFMFANVLAFKMLIIVDKQVLSPSKRSALLLYPFVAFAFELLEIIRTVPISGTGVWFPYANWLF